MKLINTLSDRERTGEKGEDGEVQGACTLLPPILSRPEKHEPDGNGTGLTRNAREWNWIGTFRTGMELLELKWNFIERE